MQLLQLYWLFSALDPNFYIFRDDPVVVLCAYIVRNHEPLQWYDIVHFEHKLLWLYFRFPQKPRTNGDVFPTYKPIINS